MLRNQESQWLAGSRRKTQPAGSWLLRQGEPQSKIHLLHHGVARAVYHADNGVERVKEFYFAGEYCFLYLNWLINTPADYSLQMISAGETTEFPLALLDAPENQDIKTQLLVQQLIYKEKKSKCCCSIPQSNATSTYKHTSRTGSHSSPSAILPAISALPPLACPVFASVLTKVNALR